MTACQTAIGEGGGRRAGLLCAALVCAASLLPAAATAADPFPDDHGDTPAEATLLVPGGSPSNSTVEIDTDQDWFRFVAQTGVYYRIVVTSVSIWDAALEVRGADGASVLAVTNSAGTSAPPRATLTVPAPRGGGACYVGISGFLRFTTGTCTVAVQPLPGSPPAPAAPRRLRGASARAGGL